MSKLNCIKSYKLLQIIFIGFLLPLLLNSNCWPSSAINFRIKQHLELLIDPSSENDQEAIKQLKKIPDVVENLIEILKKEDNNSDIRFSAIVALTQIAPTKTATIQALIEALADKDQDVRAAATGGLETALDEIESQDALKEAITNLRKAAVDPKNWKVQVGAAEALGSSGRDVQIAAVTLEKLLQSKDKEVRRNAIKALKDISRSLPNKVNSLSPAEKLKAKQGLKKAIQALKNPKEDLETLGEDIDEVNKSLSNTLKIVEPLPFLFLMAQLLKWISENPKISVATILIFTWFSSDLILLWVHPILLLRLNKVLQKYTDLPLPNFLGGINIATLRLLLFGLPYHPRVLDAWVKLHLDTAGKEFQNKPTVKTRNIHIALPVVLDGENKPELTAKDLQPNFAQKQECLLIWGEGGSGKTSLACQLAKWAMSPEPEQRLCKHRMLPILVEQELDFKVAEGKQPFTELIRGLLEKLLDGREQISEELLEQLLRQQRLLVIVDRFSEMSDATRQAIRPELPEFCVNALVVTSRIEETLGKINRTTLKPMRVEGNHLSSFMEAYLTKLGKRDLFNDREFFEDCSRLSAIASQGNITVLLAKLYADQMISGKEGKNREDLPDNIPDLMIHYLNQLNSSVADNKLDNRTVHRDAKIVAWECLQKTYRPATAQREHIIAALGENDAEKRLNYLEKRLCIIQTVSPDETQIRFSLDPLAEYLAALHLLESYSNNENLWLDFLKNANKQQGTSGSIKGFLVAVSTCCLNKRSVPNLPNFLINELTRQTGLEQGNQ